MSKEGKFRFSNLSERNKLLCLSLLVGILSGLAAVALNLAVDSLRSLVGADPLASRWGSFVLPGVGMLLSLLLVRFVIRDNIGHGVTKVLLAVSRNESRIKPHNTWSSMLTSALTIGLGGSVGAEAPIVYTGAAIGSNLARKAGLSYRNVTVLLGCGAAGAIAGIFKAPLAGVLFTMEILLFNLSMSSMVPMLLSTVSATVVSYVFRGQTPVFACTLTEFSMINIPFYVLLGGVAGLASLYFTGGALWLEDKLGKISDVYLRWAVCALSLGLIIFLFPPLYGEGYDSLGALLQGREVFEGGSRWGVPLFFAGVFLLKVVSMTLTNSGGGVGGTFGPTLFEGAVLGFVVARSLNILLEGADFSIPEQNFVLVGMAAMMASVMQAPMTAIFLIAEISGGYELLIPLILTSAVSFGTVRLFEKYSIYTKRLAQSGDLLTHDNDQAVLTLMKTRDLIRDKYPRLHPEQTLRALVDTVSESTAAVIAVVDDENVFQGYIDVDSCRKDLFRTSEYKSLHVYNMMSEPPAVIMEDEKMDSVMSKFDSSQAWRLPVLDREGHYLGFISKSRVLMAYRDELKVISHD